MTNARISDLIREERTEEIPDAVAEGGFFEMQTFQQALIEHVLAGRVERDIAANASSNHTTSSSRVDHAHEASDQRDPSGGAGGAGRQAEEETPALRVIRPAGA